MSNRRCPKCGEEYSDTYRSCPFCEEEEALKHGKRPHRQGGHRAEKRRRSSGGAGGVMMLLLGVIVIGVGAYVAFGDDVAGAVGIRMQDEAPAITDTEDGEPEKIPVAQAGTVNTDPGPAVTDEPQGDEPVEAPGTGEPLALSQDNITIPAGETGRLSATGGNGTVTWSSTNPEIASVEDGSVTGKAGGTVTITATSGEETASCTVKVEGDAWVDPNASSYKLSKDDFTLSSGESSWQLKIKRGEGWEVLGSADGVTWASSNTGVATVSDTGVVQRVGRGNTTITATIGGTVLECIARMG